MRRGHAGVIAGLAVLLLTALLAAGEAAAQPVVTDDEQACVSVANLTQFNWPVTIAREGRRRSTVNVKSREVMRYCAPTKLKAGERIIVVLRSSWLPLGECKLLNRGTMEIYREPDKNADSGESTKVKCYEGR